MRSLLHKCLCEAPLTECLMACPCCTAHHICLPSLLFPCLLTIVRHAHEDQLTASAGEAFTDSLACAVLLRCLGCRQQHQLGADPHRADWHVRCLLHAADPQAVAPQIQVAPYHQTRQTPYNTLQHAIDGVEGLLVSDLIKCWSATVKDRQGHTL